MGAGGEVAERQAEAAAVRPIALIAGSGDLPLSIAQALRKRGRAVFVAAIEEEADRDYGDFPHVRARIGAPASIKQALVDQGCFEILIAGGFHRPKFSDIALNLDTFRVSLAAVMGLRFGGDDSLLTRLAGVIEAQGFRLVGPRDVVPEMFAEKGVLGNTRPSRRAREDIGLGTETLRKMGELDIGQALVVVGRRIVAVEAAEGTTAMIERCEALRASGRLRAAPPSGVMVKMPKPGQEERLDMPVIGPDTVRVAARAGLAGLAVEAGGVLVVDQATTTRLADEAGMFIVGFPAQ